MTPYPEFLPHRPQASDRTLRRGQRSGFALLITVTLLAFLVLLLVSLASLTRVETQVAANTQKLAQARQNALLALNVAIGHLQQATGPDQRLTARADLTSGASNQPYLTGVWEPAAGGNPTLKTWLVSGNQGSDPLDFKPSTAASADDVILVGDDNPSTLAQQVKLPRRSISVPTSSVPGLGSGGDVVIGHYAYWVGDEGVKASAALNDQTDDLNYDNTIIASPPDNAPTTGANWSVDTDLRGYLRQLAPAHPHLPELFSDYTNTPALNVLLPRALNYEQLGLLDPANLTRDKLYARFHDATTISRAVLVDHTRSVDGGLRQDLSDSPDVYPSALRNFVKERADTRSGLQSTHAQKQSENRADTAFPMFSKGLVLTEFLIRFQFSRNAGNGNLRLKYEVQAELWNPYATTLGAASDLAIRVANLPTVTVTSSDGDGPYTVNLNTVAPLFGYVDPALVWAPGQIRWVKGAGGPGTLYAPDSTTAGTARSVGIANSPIAPGSTLEISIPPVSSGTPLTVEVKRGGLWLATYKPLIDFQPGTATNDSPSLSDAGWHFGYAYDFRNDIRDWIDPTRASAQDPRRTNLDGTFFETADSAWSPQPVDNINEINLAGTDTFNASRTPLALFDLPNQESVSVGSLQHLIGEKPYRLGNPTTGSLTTVNDYFDRYYFSTLPRWHSWTALNPPALPNRYMEVHVPDPANPPETDDIYGKNSTTSAADHLMDRTHAAKYLMIRGAFNINSTSEPAWRAVLSGIQISNWSYGGATPQTTNHLGNAFFRFSHGAQELDTDPHEPPRAANAFNRGTRPLTSGQIELMAASIVTQLKARGTPYPTLRDFIDDGVITQAIASAGINTADLDDVPAYSPGWLSQADVLTAIAPFITPRSDTFRIRAYGDAQNPVTGATEGRARCEAVVQRIPDLTTPASGTLIPASDPLQPSETKFPFGRQFRIISFQWLSPHDF